MNNEEMSDSELLDFICRMKNKARRAHRGQTKRVQDMALRMIAKFTVSH